MKRLVTKGTFCEILTIQYRGKFKIVQLLIFCPETDAVQNFGHRKRKIRGHDQNEVVKNPVKTCSPCNKTSLNFDPFYQSK